ncbi:MAG: hypothetical protein BWY70_00595 [Bacteroidetes bacterium ADurb.Bin408]|nr:MAG: hypothetical protein BWY70_00595 [Bacteroidetes bacterium ADurb.Bin408]
MKRLIIALCATLFLAPLAGAQKLQTVAAYDNQSSYTSGLYGLADTGVFRYSWYYHEWFPLENTGLTRVNDTIRVSALAVYNNKINNSSGIFVFSDTAVFNYNWITATWYALKNTGLPRLFNKPDIRMLTVYGDSGSSSNSTLFALTDTAVYRYSWFYQEWSPLPNTGLPLPVNKAAKTAEQAVTAWPNPFRHALDVRGTLPENYTGPVEMAVFDAQGRWLEHLVTQPNRSAEYVFKPDMSRWSPGMYFFEIKVGSFFKTIKAVKIE